MRSLFRAYPKIGAKPANKPRTPQASFSLCGFTIAELLICLMILGEIATFTIPKLLTSQQNQRFNAITKEDIATLAQAFQMHSLSGNLSSNTSAADLIQYINYIQKDTSSQLDDVYGYAGIIGCSAVSPCARMANGSLIHLNNCTFNGTNAQSNVIEAFIDPDGGVTSGGDATSDGKSTRAYVYYSGRVATWGTISDNSSSACFTWSKYQDPPYLQW